MGGAGAGAERRSGQRVERLASWVVPTLLVVLSFSLYARNLDDYFLADDFELISSFYGEGLGYLSGLLVYNESGDAWAHLGRDPESGGYLRPLKIWLLALDLRLWGTDAAGFHRTATAAFALNVVMVFLIARLFVGAAGWPLAGAAAVVTALHPTFGHIVPSITFREETLATGFGLVAVHAFLRHRIVAGPLWPACLFLALSLLSKESGVSTLLLIGGFDLVAWLTAGDRAADLRRRLPAYVPLGALVVVYLGLRTIAFGDPVGGWDDPRLTSSFFTYHAALWRSFFHPSLFAWHGFPYAGVVVAALAAAALAAIAVLRRFARGDWVALLYLGPVWYLAASLVNLGTYFDPRHHVLVVVGFALATALVLEGLARALGRAVAFARAGLAIGACAIAAVLFLPTTLALSSDYDQASRAVKRIRARIERRTAALEPECSVLLEGVPIYKSPPYYFGWGLQASLKKPFTETDLANRCLVVSEADVWLNRREIERPSEYDVEIRFHKDWPEIRPYDWN